MIALQFSETPPENHPRHHLDLQVASGAEQEAEAHRLACYRALRP